MARFWHAGLGVEDPLLFKILVHPVRSGVRIILPESFECDWSRTAIVNRRESDISP